MWRNTLEFTLVFKEGAGGWNFSRLVCRESRRERRGSAMGTCWYPIARLCYTAHISDNEVWNSKIPSAIGDKSELI